MTYCYAMLLALVLAVPAPLFAHEDAPDAGAVREHAAAMRMDHAAADNTLKLELIPQTALSAGKTGAVVARLTTLADGKPVTFANLMEAHTKKLHLLIVDPSLSDYQHIHPVPAQKPGEYVFEFTPQKAGSYRGWADVVPIATGAQEFVVADMGQAAAAPVAMEKTVRMETSVGGYRFTLALDQPPVAGVAVMGNVTVSKDGAPFTQLEPVMGAFAHIVGFADDYRSVLHVHPMGAEPIRSSERGGPRLDFHIEPAKPGFVKLFAQVRIGGKDLFAPFGMVVK